MNTDASTTWMLTAQHSQAPQKEDEEEEDKCYVRSSN